MKKYIISTAIIIVLLIAAMILFLRQGDEKDNSVALETLQLIQIDSYIAISSNDITAYNRGIPFYLSVETKGKNNAEDVTDFFYETFDSVMLYSDAHGILFSTDSFIWAMAENTENQYNITLFIRPGLDEFIITEATKVDKIIFSANNEKMEYDLINCTVEAKETILEDKLYVASAVMLTDINEDLSAAISYGFFENTASVEGIELYYPAGFAKIEKHDFPEMTYRDDGVVYYQGYLHFLSKNEKVVFRPFIQVNYDGSSGWVVPAVPAYINYLNQNPD
ncbi:MAG: hypothetical protein FWG91_07425 [Lachnospiraceae bacterium]|nr:hypothetical protein [Lachnospiraceae bacterium]